MWRPNDATKEKIEAVATGAAKDAAAIDVALFERTPLDESGAERTGYSNYSYWRSTFRVFFRKKTAVFLLFLLAFILLFTVIQPLLPRQHEASKIVNHPITKLQMSNVSPALTTVRRSVPSGTPLVVSPMTGNEGWSAVTNVLAVIPRREKLQAVEYLGGWILVQYKDQTGYILNDFTTKLKLPDAPEAVPYETYSNFPVNLYTSPEDCTENGKELFARTSALEFSADGKSAVTRAETELRILPSEDPFVFGTNNAGQDLWSLVWAGTRTSLFIGFTVAVVQALVGITIGVLWGYVRKLDFFFTELYNVVNNIPTTIILILASYIMRPSVKTIIIAMCITGWIVLARFIRNLVVIIRDQDFNVASRCLGSPLPKVIVKNLLPHMVSVIMLRMALAIPEAIGNEVFMTYIGLGVPIETPSLGNLINAGRILMMSPSLRYQLIFPAIVLSVITICFYLTGNFFADAADPKNHV